ncbi:MAG: hypothetical protein C0490_19420, partial [Marivirga sp.]|nr:hypothetical protein [Marivirga sp.]
SKEFVILVTISLFISVPTSYYFMKAWVEHYGYHITLSWTVFLFAGAGAIVITLATVSYQSIRAALANPVESLRTE